MAAQFKSVTMRAVTSIHRPSLLMGVYRLDDGLACTLWLERRGSTWELASVHVHPLRDVVHIGPISDDWTDDYPELVEDGLLAVERVETTHDLAQEAADEEPAAVTSRVLRELPIGQLVDDLRKRMYEPLKETYRSRQGSADPERLASEWANYLEGEFFRPGRKGRPDVFYAGVAADYVAALEGGSRSPARDIATEHNYSVSMVNNWISEARRRELLTEAPTGRAGGELTERARELLASEGDR